MESDRFKQMDKHINILGGLYIIMGILVIASAGLMFLGMVVGGLLAEETEAFITMSGFAVIMAGFMVALSLPSLFAGYGLLKRKNWARFLSIVLGFFQLMSFPIGTAVALYTFYVLFQKDADDFFLTAKVA